MYNKKIIFLDIDGVLNHEKWYSESKGKSGNIDPSSVALLNQLKGVDVVISSSWGKSADAELNKNGLTLKIVGHTNHYWEDWVCRGNEIAEWLKDHYDFNKFNGDAHVDYVIIDDDSDILLCQNTRFIKTNRAVGITQEDINKIKQILEI